MSGLNIGVSLNETITRLVIEKLRASNQSFADATTDAILRKTSQARIIGAIGSLTGLPVFYNVKDFAHHDLVRDCDPQVLSACSFVPVRRNEHRVVVAVANPWDYRADDYCSQHYPNLEVVKILTLATDISSVIESMTTGTLPDAESLAGIEVDELVEETADFNVTKEYDEPMSQLVATILCDAIKQKASDIHIKTEQTSFYYAFRVDGDIGRKIELPQKLRDRIDAFLLNLMGIPPEDRIKRPGISGRFTANYYGRGVGIRFERHRTYRGYHVTMRLLDKSGMEAKLGMGSLAFDENTLFELEKVMSIPCGIIVMSGPTGSGKSTTLNAMLRELNHPQDNILTLENPVEDEIPGVTHCDLKSSDEFKPMIASFMRSDPDIILMGEVRDKESAELAVEAAITGHKVLTTIHTPSASQIIERFEQLGIERWKIAETLRAACAQRLVKKLCPICKVKLPGVSEKDIRISFLPPEWATTPIYEAAKAGCQDCLGKGYSGRTAILEILPINPKLADMLSKGELSPYELDRKVRRENNLPSLRDSGLKLLKEGKTDLAALRKVMDLTYDDKV